MKKLNRILLFQALGLMTIVVSLSLGFGTIFLVLMGYFNLSDKEIQVIVDSTMIAMSSTIVVGGAMFILAVIAKTRYDKNIKKDNLKHQ